jgi:hypothetical protein
MTIQQARKLQYGDVVCIKRTSHLFKVAGVSENSQGVWVSSGVAEYLHIDLKVVYPVKTEAKS